MAKDYSQGKTRPLVVVDPGHGGKDPGAVSPFSGRHESDVNLALALDLQEVAKSHSFDVVLLRSVDVFLSLEDRARLSNEAKPDAFLSFHSNAADNPKAEGFEVWTSPGETRADALATAIYDMLDSVLALPGRTDYDDGDPDKEARFYVLRKTTAPAVLIEFGFLTNRADEVMLADPRTRHVMVKAVADAVEDWLL